MGLMEFLKQNKLNSTGMLTVPAAQTGTVAYLFDRNKALGFTSVGYNSNTSLVLTVTLPAPTVLSRILMQNHNLKDFRVFYDGVTANSFGIVAGNSATSTYLSFASTTVSSISLQIDSAMTAAERRLGELVLTDLRLQFERNPSARDFDPMVARKKIDHEMPDGGLARFNIKNKYKASVKWAYVTDTFATNLRSVYDDALPLYFLPYPTTTGWDGVAHECIWQNDFDFTYDDNSKTAGQGGTIRLWETSNT